MNSMITGTLRSGIKLCIFADIVTGIAKFAGAKIQDAIENLLAKFQPQPPPPVTSKGIEAVVDNIKNFFGNIGSQAVSGTMKVVTAPVSFVGKGLSVVGSFFIPCVIVTVILIAIMIVMKFVRKKQLDYAKEKVANPTGGGRDLAGDATESHAFH